MLSPGPHCTAAPSSPTATGASFATTRYRASSDAEGFSDRRKPADARDASERRQFGSLHSGLSPEAKELAVAIDRYKLAFCRRYITSEEILTVITQLGYRRVDRL